MWHGACSLSCADVAFTLLLKGHRVDPIQAADFNVFAVVRRVISKDGEAATTAEEAWRITESKPKEEGVHADAASGEVTWVDVARVWHSAYAQW